MDEEHALRNRFWHPTAGQTVLDIGCYHGSWTLPALRAGATVHAFDTNAEALNHLQDAAHTEGVAERLTTVHAAVGHQYPPDLTNQIPDAMRPTGPWLTIDKYTHSHSLRVDWIKIDVEGGELAVLHTARQVLDHDRPRLMVELHHLVYQTPHTQRWRELDLLLDHGYRTNVEILEGYDRRPIHLTAEPA